MAGHILCLYMYSSDWGYLEVCIMISWGSLLQFSSKKTIIIAFAMCICSLRWKEFFVYFAVCSWLSNKNREIYECTHIVWIVAINFLDDQKTIFFLLCIMKCFKWLLSFVVCPLMLDLKVLHSTRISWSALELKITLSPEFLLISIPLVSFDCFHCLCWWKLLKMSK